MTERGEELSFEAAVRQLEEIVAAMEGGSLTLDESLRHFERAVSLSRLCSARLDEAERQVSVLADENGRQPARGLAWLDPADPEN